MIKLMIILGAIFLFIYAILLFIFWVFGSIIIKHQEWLNEHDDQQKEGDEDGKN